jgi:hypothetical protein
MGDTSSETQSSTMAALTNASTAALISAAASAAASAVAASSSSGPSQSINIKGLIPITLDMQSNSYRRWKNLFRTVLGRYDLLSHVESAATRPDDPAWVQADLTVVMWLQATLGDDLLDIYFSAQIYSR